eukprot:c24999_g22_i1 orf=286-762(-)
MQKKFGAFLLMMGQTNLPGKQHFMGFFFPGDHLPVCHSACVYLYPVLLIFLLAMETRFLDIITSHTILGSKVATKSEPMHGCHNPCGSPQGVVPPVRFHKGGPRMCTKMVAGKLPWPLCSPWRPNVNPLMPGYASSLDASAVAGMHREEAEDHRIKAI